MKLLAVRIARAVWLVPRYFLNPRGAFLRPALALVRDRYKFAVFPDDTGKPNDGESYRFENGSFAGQNGHVQLLRFEFHPDGFVAETRSSTQDAEAFLTDVTTFVIAEMGLPVAAEVPYQKLYASEVNVVFDKDPVLLNPKLATFFDEVSEVVGDKPAGGCELVGLQFGPDQSRSDKPAFKLEREIRTPFEQKRYYSFAPTTTESHIRLLEKLDSIS